MFWLDRRRQEQPRRLRLHDSLHPPQAQKPMELGQHRSRAQAHQFGAHAPSRIESLRGRAEPASHLLLRAAKCGAIRCSKRTPIPRPQEGLEVLSGPTTLVSANRHRWVISAKRDETRQTRLAQLIAASARGQSIAPLQRKPEVPKRQKKTQ